MKKRISILIIFLLIFMNTFLSAASSEIEKKNKENITIDQFFQLLEKYDMRVLTNEEVTELGLVVDKKKEKLDLNYSYEEMDAILKNLKESLNNPPINNTILEKELVEIPYSEYFSSGVSSTNGSGSRTVESSITSDTGLTDFTLRFTVAIAYTYNWENLPGEPYREFNHNITSYSQGSVTEVTQGGYTRMTSSSSSAIKESSTTIRQYYEVTYDQYIPISYFWIKVGSGNLNGRILHRIP